MEKPFPNKVSGNKSSSSVHPCFVLNNNKRKKPPSSEHHPKHLLSLFVVWKLCVCVCAHVVGQRNYQKHAAGFFQSNINQTDKEKAPRSVSGLTDKCGRSLANVWDANMHFPPLSFIITQFVWDLHIWFMKAVCARERGWQLSFSSCSRDEWVGLKTAFIHNGIRQQSSFSPRCLGNYKSKLKNGAQERL